jgi:hypothetical protein
MHLNANETKKINFGNRRYFPFTPSFVDMENVEHKIRCS